MSHSIIVRVFCLLIMLIGTQPVYAAPSAPVLVSPAGVVSGSEGRPLFRIQTQGEVLPLYQVIVIDAETAQTHLDQMFVTGMCDANRTLCELTAVEGSQTLLYNGDYIAYARGAAPQATTTWSAGIGFTIQEAPPPVAALQLKSLDNDSGMPCPRPQSTAAPVCAGTPVFVFLVNQNGVFSGDWVELVITDAAHGVVFQRWLHVGDDLHCNPACYFRPGQMFADGVYRWYLRSWGPGGGSSGGLSGYTEPGNARAGDPENIGEFHIGAALAIGDDLRASVNLTRAAGEVTFSWPHTPDADWYEITLVNAAGQIVNQSWYPVATAGLADTALVCQMRCHIIPALALPNGVYRWYLRLWDGRLSDYVAAPQPITLNLPAPGRIPIESLQNKQQRFVWQAVDNATWYGLRIISPFGEITSETWYRGLLSCGTLCQVVLTTRQVQENSGGTWQVSAYGPGGWAAWSETAPLGNANDTGDVTLTLARLFPLDNHIWTPDDGQLRLTWENTRMPGYQFQIIDTATALIVVDETLIPECSTLCIAYITSPLPPSRYQWRVRALSSTHVGLWVPLHSEGVDFEILP